MDDEGSRRDIVGCVRLSFKLRAFTFNYVLYKCMYCIIVCIVCILCIV